MFKENGLNAVVLSHAIDSHFISFLEYKEHDKLQFVRIDSDISDEIKNSDVDKQKAEKIADVFKKSVDVEGLEVEIGHLKSVKTPGVLLVSEYERRMSEIEKLYGQTPFGMQAPKISTKIVLNADNDSVKKILELDEEKAKLVCQYIYDLALIANKPLSSDEMSAFIDRSTKILSFI